MAILWIANKQSQKSIVGNGSVWAVFNPVPCIGLCMTHGNVKDLDSDPPTPSIGVYACS